MPDLNLSAMVDLPFMNLVNKPTKIFALALFSISLGTIVRVCCLLLRQARNAIDTRVTGDEARGALGRRKM